MTKEGVKVLTDGSDILDAPALMLSMDKEKLEDLRQFDTEAKIEAEIKRLTKARGA